MKKLLSVFFIASVLFLSSCDNGSTPEEMKVEIVSAGWYYKNISTAWQDMAWGGTNNTSTAYFDFTLWYEGEKILPEELVSFTAQADGYTYTVPVDKDIHLDSSSDPNKHGLDGYYVWTAGSNNHAMPLGPWTFTLTFADESETVHTRTFNKPGTTNTIENTYFITEDYAAGAGTSHFPMVKRATVTEATYDSASGDLTVKFNVNDTLARSGWVRIYDSNGDYVTSSADRFVGSNDVVDTKLNTGASFNTDGTENTFVVNLATEMNSAVTTSGTYRAVVVLIDGKHYTDGSYDGMSYSDPSTAFDL